MLSWHDGDNEQNMYSTKILSVSRCVISLQSIKLQAKMLRWTGMSMKKNYVMQNT